MISRVLSALVVAIAVGLLCLLIGAVLGALAVPPAVIVGGFLVQWCWVIGILAGLWWFLQGSGWSWPRRGAPPPA